MLFTSGNELDVGDSIAKDAWLYVLEKSILPDELINLNLPLPAVPEVCW